MISIHPMYSAGHVAAATFLGGPLGGAWLLALNYKRLGAPGKARLTIVLAVLAMVALIAILAAASSRVPPVAILPVIVMYSLARSLQGAAYDRHVRAGGSVGSIWRVIGIALASLAITVAVGAGAMAIYQAAFAPVVDVGDSNVFYAGGATRDEAQAVGDALVALDYFQPKTPATVQVTRDRGRHVVAFVAQDIAFSDDELQLEFHRLAEPLSRKVYGGVQVDVWLTDDELEPRVKLTWETRPRELDLGDHHIVRYQQGGQEAEARGVGKVLEESGYFPAGQPATAIVMRVSSGAVVELFFDRAAFGDTAGLSAEYHKLAEPLSAEAFGGKPVDVWLTDERGVARAKLAWEERPQ